MDTHIAAPPELEEREVRISPRHPGPADRDVSPPTDAGPPDVVAGARIAALPEHEDRVVPLSARLPGEPDPDAPPTPDAGSPERLAISSREAQPKGKHRLLLGGTAVVAVVALAGGAFLLSPYNHVVPVPKGIAAAVHQVANSAGIDTDRPLAPSASLAGIDLPSRPAAVVLPRYTPEPRDQDLAEVLAVRPGAAASGAPSASQAARAKQGKPTTTEQPAQTAQAFVPHEPGSAIISGPATPNTPPPLMTEAAASPIPPHAAARDITKAVVAAAGPEVAQPQPKPVAQQAAPLAEQQEGHKPDAAPAPAGKPAPPGVAPASAPLDAASQAIHLQAGPMSNGDQIQVLELVTKIATMVSDLKSQGAALRADFAKTTADNQARLADFARRIALTEAIKAVAVAQHASDPAANATPAVADPLPGHPAAVLTPVAVTRPDVAVPSTAPQDAKRYRVQAASPGLALLTEIARGGGDGAQIQLTVGDTIPGWGKVKSVSQRGTSWVVSTDKGVIE